MAAEAAAEEEEELVSLTTATTDTHSRAGSKDKAGQTPLKEELENYSPRLIKRVVLNSA
ncbi:hypothetical protein EGR_10123 [Echinococcus granulosus]|uniref:Uncharacterized protein n=1 Tax=Echinococcus granulosus TaxID=6210 RepID=W6U967_ECHGR|nr:hypothetical protein EGR_10123 [Echinococcus granulosus]EUB55027.1 hypothetical protein EGR_10123 [Echinococcus granulosus]